jgi:hypothetical protein
MLKVNTKIEALIPKLRIQTPNCNTIQALDTYTSYVVGENNVTEILHYYATKEEAEVWYIMSDKKVVEKIYSIDRVILE